MKIIVLTFFLLWTTQNIFTQNADQVFGFIRELTGTVELQNAGAASFVLANIGDEVAEYTVISTGFRSSALIEVGNTLVTVRPLTRLTLTEIRASQGHESFNVHLQAGRVRVDISPPAGSRASMSVISPEAVASVRGTSFEFDTRNLQVSEGNVYFRGNLGFTVLVIAGSSVDVGPYNISSSPRNRAQTTLRPPRPTGSDLSGGGNIGGVGVITRGPVPEDPPNEPFSPPYSPSTPITTDDGTPIGITFN
jgi:hypothetical protein